MEQITPDQVGSPRRAPYPIPILPRYAVLVFIVVSGFAVANIGVKAIRQYNPLPTSDPFAAFADLFPGEPGSAIEAHNFSCIDNDYYGHPAEENCSFQPTASSFSSVDVLIYHDMILKTTFLLRENSLTVGDLAAYLETNELQVYPNQVAFVLPEKVVIAKPTIHDGQSSPFLSVWSVSFIDKSILD